MDYDDSQSATHRCKRRTVIMFIIRYANIAITKLIDPSSFVTITDHEVQHRIKKMYKLHLKNRLKAPLRTSSINPFQ